jgi:hypothetical protein
VVRTRVGKCYVGFVCVRCQKPRIIFVHRKDMPFEFFCVQLYFVLCVYCNRSRLGVFKNGVLTEYLDLRGIK